MHLVRMIPVIALLSVVVLACQEVEILPPGPNGPSQGSGLPGNPDLNTGGDDGDNIFRQL